MNNIRALIYGPLALFGICIIGFLYIAYCVALAGVAFYAWAMED